MFILFAVIIGLALSVAYTAGARAQGSQDALQVIGLAASSWLQMMGHASR